MKTKVIHLLSHLKMGGAETLVTDYALKINKDMFDIVLVTISERNDTINEKKLERAGVKVVFLGDKVTFHGSTNIIKRGINKLQRYILFSKTVKQEKPDVIHTHLGTNGFLLPIKTKGIKLFHTIHNEVNIMFEKVNRVFPTKYCIKRKGMIPIALHTKMQQEVNDLFNINSCLVVPNAIDINRFINVKLSKEEILEQLQIKRNSFIVGHVGRFTKQKNHEFLIDIFAAIKEKEPNAHLILVGIGALEKQARDQVGQLNLIDSVSFLGNREDIPELMSVMDVFVFPSLYEGFGNVLIEAQAARIQCVASETVPRDAFLTNLVTSLSLDDKIETWAQTIVSQEYSDEIRGDLAKHNINNVIKDLENLYLS